MALFSRVRLALRNFVDRLGIVGQFAIASLIPVVILGLVLGAVLDSEITSRALTNGRQTARLIGSTLVQPLLQKSDFTGGLRSPRLDQLQKGVDAAIATKQVALVKVWSTNGTLVYASDHSLIGKKFKPEDQLASALRGKPASDVTNLNKAENAGERYFKRLLEVYTPVRFPGDRTPSGAFEIYQPYAPIAAAIASDDGRMVMILLAGLILLYLAVFRIALSTSRKIRRQAKENEYLAHHDVLTELPNRILFQDQAQRAIESAQYRNATVALMVINVDRFKDVNDTLGHNNGDKVLREVGRRLQVALPRDAGVASLGGDEFAVFLPGQNGSEDPLVVAEKLGDALRAPLSLAQVEIDLATSIGVACFPDHGSDAEGLLLRADVAMHFAKENHSGFSVYSEGQDEYSPQRLLLVVELKKAIADGELQVYFQPKATLSSGNIIGAEALVRWQHQRLGQLLPDAFIPLAERTGLIRNLTLYVLETTLEQQSRWMKRGHSLTISVNLSARDVLDEALPQTIARLLEKYEVPSELLQLELTESMLLSNPEQARAILTDLDQMGVKIAIDDFGTGYSSLAYLKRLPISEIKIDRSFVSNMINSPNDSVIVQSTIDLAHNLGLTVVAEGVETIETWSRLISMDCDVVQGFYLGRALIAAEFETLLREEPNWKMSLQRAQARLGSPAAH